MIHEPVSAEVQCDRRRPGNSMRLQPTSIDDEGLWVWPFKPQLVSEGSNLYFAMVRCVLVERVMDVGDAIVECLWRRKQKIEETPSRQTPRGTHENRLMRPIRILRHERRRYWCSRIAPVSAEDVGLVGHFTKYRVLLDKVSHIDL